MRCAAILKRPEKKTYSIRNMLKTVFVFLGGIFFGFWFSWLTPISLINYWGGGDVDKNATLNTILDKPDEGVGERGCFHIDKEVAPEVNVLCMVQTSPETHHRTAHIKATWGRRCNVLLFLSTTDEESIPTVALPVAEGKNHAWSRVKESFKYVYRKHIEHEREPVDWVLAVDDETYVVVENLRYLLSRHNPLEPVYFGRSSKPKSVLLDQDAERNGRVDGKAGYLLSREAVRRFAVEVLNGNHTSGEDGKVEGVSEMGKCMEVLNVKAGISNETLAKGRFPPLKLSVKVRLQLANNSSTYPSNDGGGWDCCPDLAITFHRSSYMYTLEYLLYYLFPFGITR